MKAMDVLLRPFEPEDIKPAAALWNAIVAQGDSFPNEAEFTEEEALACFCGQTETVCAFLGDELVGMYILHPNHVGRCGHIANASYAVKRERRGHGIGRRLVSHSLEQAKRHGFRGLQFNAVVAGNKAAIALYRSLGFREVGTIPGGYRLKDGSYDDLLLFFYQL